MKTILTLTLLILVASTAVLGQNPEVSEQRKLEAGNELNEGARAYKEGRYYEAQLRFEKAAALDPTQKNASFFIARATHAQFKPGVESPENVAKAREAIAAYQRALEIEPVNEEAYNAIVYLFRAIKDEVSERDWLTRGATDGRWPAEKRSQATVVLASKEWQCSYNVTERKENKRTVMRGGKALIKYRKPKEQKDYDEAAQCAARGIELVEQAISLDAASEQAWAYKTNLLVEMVKLAEMDNDMGRASEYQKQADEARQRTAELNEQNQKKRGAEGRREAGEEAGRPPQSGG